MRLVSASSEGLAQRLRGHVEMLAGTIGERNVFLPERLAAARDYIETTWRAQGYEVHAQEYQTHGVTCANLEVSLTGASRPREILLFGAHYDSVRDCPGANDNGSGVAALLEIARHFAGLRPALTVRLVAFVNEEPPFFMTRRQGSAVYAKAARARGDDIRLMVSLETLGYYSDAPGSQRYPPLFRFFYPERGDFLGLVSDLRSRRVMRQVAKVFRDRSDFPMQHTATLRWIPGIAWSDHLPFWRQGYPALMATDTAFYRYRYYHTVLDTPDKLAYPAFGRATEALGSCFTALAEQGLE
jgi:Zn-dependent M28 family amino/carboxypeptidase